MRDSSCNLSLASRCLPDNYCEERVIGRLGECGKWQRKLDDPQGIDFANWVARNNSTAGHLPTGSVVPPSIFVPCISDARTKLVADETKVPVLEPGRGETKTQTLPRAIRYTTPRDTI